MLPLVETIKSGASCSPPARHMLCVNAQVATANVGDSRAMIVRGAPGNRLQAIPLTQDAKPELPGVRVSGLL